MVDSGSERVWLGRCKLGGCCFEEEHSGECNDGNMSDQEYEVECITAEKLVRKKRVYRVKWRGWPEADSTWEKESSLADAKECLEEWKQSKRLKKTAMAAPEETKPAATEVEVTEAEEKEVVVLTDTEAEDTEAEEAEAEETEPMSEEVEARTDDKAVAAADARAAAVEPQVASSVGTLSELQADADVWLSVLEEVALLREGVPPKRTYDEPTFVAHTLPFQALQLVSQVCKAWRIDEATPKNERIWKALCERRWPSAVQMEAPCDHRALFKTLSQPLGRFELAFGVGMRGLEQYSPDVFGKEPIKFDPEMRELQKGFHATSKKLQKSKEAYYDLKGGTLADVTLLVDIHTAGGAHLLSHALRGPPTVRLKYPKSTYRPHPTGDEICWTFVTPLPPGWHKVDKKVSCSLVNARLGKARLILDRQTVSDSWYDMTKPIEYNMQDAKHFKKSYGGQDAPELEQHDEAEMYVHPLLNIEEAGGNLTISLYAVGSGGGAEGLIPLGLIAWLEPIRKSGLASANPRRLPTPPNFDW